MILLIEPMAEQIRLTLVLRYKNIKWKFPLIEKQKKISGILLKYDERFKIITNELYNSKT